MAVQVQYTKIRTRDSPIGSVLTRTPRGSPCPSPAWLCGSAPGPLDREHGIAVGRGAGPGTAVGRDLVAHLPVVGGEFARERGQAGRVGRVLVAAVRGRGPPARRRGTRGR